VIEYHRLGPAPHSPLATEHLVRMRDGVRLASDVYLTDEGAVPGPTILIRLPYDKVGDYTFIPRVAAYMASRGYRVVAQDVRGKFRSEGETLLFVNEADDGYDTIDWIIQQEWSDGSVAMWGDSYYGFTQLAAVSSGHPALRAIAPRVTGTRLGERPVTVPGTVTRDVEMTVALMYPLTHFHSRDTFEWEPDWSARPLRRDLDAFVEQLGARSPSFDLSYPWHVELRRFPNGSPFDQPAIPTLMTIGWWDNCAPWSWADHELIGVRPTWSINEYLLLESIDHENYFLDDAFRVDPRPEEAFEAVVRAAVDPALEFFDVFVRGLAPADSIPKVRWNLAHTAGHRISASWPPPGTEPRVLYASAEGELVPDAPDVAADVAWRHDPADLVPSSARNPFAFLLEKPDEAALADRNDVVVFTAGPLAADLDLVGPVRAVATVASTGPTMDVFVRVLDLAPDGSALRIARGQVHVADAVEREVTVDLGHVGYRLGSGHRLRVHLSSSDFPEFVPQPGTGEDPWGATAAAVNDQRVRVGGPDGFRIEFGVLPGETN
jgi:putative CocE/NonD family hydrolase